MNNCKELLEVIENLDSVKRLKQLEKYIDSNDHLKNALEELLSLQKQMINCRHLELTNAYNQYKEKYETKKENFLSHVFVEEYLDLLDEGNKLIKSIISIIENQLSSDFL